MMKEKFQNFEEYMKIMNLNCSYNKFDMEAYNLENVFEKIAYKSIIKNRSEFGLINSGIKYLYYSNIVDLTCEYKLNYEENNIEELKIIINDTPYLIIVILTKDNKKFGVFQKKDTNNLQNMDNMNNMGGMNNKKKIKNVRLLVHHRQNQMYNQMKNENIFTSNSSLDAFIFNLDSLKNYYYNEGPYNKPIFSILYDKNRESLYGQEILNSNNNQYQLSGKSEFNIKNLEVYKLELSKINN